MPHQRRLFIKQKLKPNQNITIENQSFHHFIRVWRCQINDTITLFNPYQQLAQATCTHINRHHAILHINRISNLTPPLVQTIDLGVTILHATAMDWVIEKTTELNLPILTPIYLQNTPKALYNENKQKHWQAKMIAACQQSGRNHLMQITPPTPLSQWIKLQPNEIGFVAAQNLNPNNPSPQKIPKDQAIKCCIGPEAGWSKSQLQTILDHHFKPLHLGDLTLRAETASLLAAGLLLHAKDIL